MFQEILVNSFRGQSFTKTLPANSRTGQKHELRKFEIYTTETVCDHFSETTERNFLTLSSYYGHNIHIMSIITTKFHEILFSSFRSSAHKLSSKYCEFSKFKGAFLGK
jgi:hypothetical protein